MNTTSKQAMRAKRHNRLRHKIVGTAARPRLAVFRSNKFVYAQLIDDEAGKTVASADSRTGATGTRLEQAKTVASADSRNEKGTRTEAATAVGTAIAKAAADNKITEVVFDRGGFRYMGIVAAVADSARAAGLKL